MGRVEDKIALVTGAAQGLGAESARLLAIERAHVVVADINVERVRHKAEKIKIDGGISAM